MPNDLDTVPAIAGKQYLTRCGDVVGPLRSMRETDHLTDGNRAWHLRGDCCGNRSHDLVEEKP